jgi:pyruvate formate lyase activating enzyme
MGLVFSIERGATHDGPGLRTAVFLKGCPLRCLWCHNPESQAFTPEAYETDDGTEMKGKEMTAEEVLCTVRKDKKFYEKSGGGLTLSGGEPLAQITFTREILRMAKDEGIHTCMETSGFAPTEDILSLVPYVDLFLFDFKESDDERHKKFTGVSRELILKNLSAINDAGAKIILRCPIIPGYNDRAEHFHAISQALITFPQIIKLNLMPYHAMGASKAKRLGRKYKMPDIKTPTDEQVKEWISIINEAIPVPSPEALPNKSPFCSA